MGKIGIALLLLAAGVFGIAAAEPEPYIELTPDVEDRNPMFGMVDGYRLTYSPDFPFARARIVVEKRGRDGGSKSEIPLGELRPDRMEFGMLFGRKSDTMVQCRWLNTATRKQSGVGFSLPESHNILFRRVLDLTPGRTVMLAGSGYRVKPETWMRFYSSGERWGIGQIAALPAGAEEKIELRLLVSGGSARDAGESAEHAIAAATLKNLLAETGVTAGITPVLTPGRIAALSRYREKRLAYSSGILNLDDLFACRDEILMELLHDSGLPAAAATAIRVALRKDFAARVKSKQTMYDAGAISIDEVLALRQKLAETAARLNIPAE